jgi:hypothetical protein
MAITQIRGDTDGKAQFQRKRRAASNTAKHYVA